MLGFFYVINRCTVVKVGWSVIIVWLSNLFFLRH